MNVVLVWQDKDGMLKIGASYPLDLDLQSGPKCARLNFPCGCPNKNTVIIINHGCYV